MKLEDLDRQQLIALVRGVYLRAREDQRAAASASNASGFYRGAGATAGAIVAEIYCHGVWDILPEAE